MYIVVKTYRVLGIVYKSEKKALEVLNDLNFHEEIEILYLAFVQDELDQFNDLGYHDLEFFVPNHVNENHLIEWAKEENEANGF